MISYIKDGKNNWTVVINNQEFMNSFTFNETHPNYIGLVECVRCGDEEEFVRLQNVGKGIEDWSFGNVNYTNGILYYKNREIDKCITDRILDIMSEGFSNAPMVLFLENLYSNPSSRSITELYKFLEHKFLPISEDGCFLAWKAVEVYSGDAIKDLNGNTLVSGDYVDKYTGKSHRNNIGDCPNMARNMVDDNFNNCCSAGLHAGTLSYANDYGGVNANIILVKINPSDVVSIPSDYNFQKLRCCKYTVVSKYSKVFEQSVVLDSNIN
jgi:hypothetical protein